MDNKQIIVSELDFVNIKESLKNFLKGQSTLSDYDFEGSSLNVLMDVLSYNTHYNALYTNLALNESFIDSATKRESVVSLAGMLGYVPRSARTSTAIVDVLVGVGNSTEPFITLPKFTKFSSSKDGTVYSFYNTEHTTLVNEGGVFIARNVEIKEGTVNIESYAVTDISKYYISNANSDLSTLTVSVRESYSSSNYTTYRLATDILNIKPDDLVYYLKEIYDNKFEVYFGNDKIGKSLSNGNIVTLSYFISNKSKANGIQKFTCDNLGGATSVRTIQMSMGGDEPETIDTIKLNAPRLFNAVNRAVTADDYQAVLLNKYPNIDYINVWGGQDNVPPIYGKVFFCIKPKTGLQLSPIEKEHIRLDIIKTRNMIGITPVFIDPNFIDLEIKSTIYFDPNKTIKQSGDIKQLCTNAIVSYNDNELKQFNSIFRYSKFTSNLDSIDTAILSNITVILMRRSVTVKYNSNTPYVVETFNPIYNSNVPSEAVTSTGIYLVGDPNLYFVEDDGIGNIRRYSLNADNVRIYTNGYCGTVNYSTGVIKLTDLIITRVDNNLFELIIKPASNDVITTMNNIVQINLDKITVDVISQTSGTKNYIFTASR